MTNDTGYIIDASDAKILNGRELWQYRELFYFFTWRDLKVKYKQTVLGVVWVLLQPILTVMVFSLFFGRALNIPPQGIPYPLFVFSGLLLWTVFSSGINTAGSSMLSHAPIIKKIYFPRIIIPISAILVACIDFAISLLVFAVMIMFYVWKQQVEVHWLQVLWSWPAGIVLMLVGTTGVSCWLAALTVKYRDFRYVIPFALQIALFVSPVIYPATLGNHTWLNYIMALNPMYAAITVFRIPLIGFVGDPTLLWVSITSSILFLMVGIYYFRKTEAFFADLA